MSVTNFELAVKYQKQSQLLTSWNAFDEDVAALEIDSAATISGAKLDVLHIIIPHEHRLETPDNEASSFKRWQSFLVLNGVELDHLQKNSHGHLVVPAKTLFVAITKFSYRTAKPISVLNKIKNIVVVATIIIPIIYQFMYFDGYDVWAILFMIFSSCLIQLYLSTVLDFLIAATMDAQRRLMTAKLLSILMRVESKISTTATEYDFSTIPKLVMFIIRIVLLH